MKNFFSRFKAPIVLFVALVFFGFLFFPYLFSNKKWEAKTQIRVVEKGWTTELVGTANDFPDTKVVDYILDNRGNKINVASHRDFVNNKPIEVEKAYYVYALRSNKICLSEESCIQNYGLRWKYYWSCDKAPIRSTIIWIIFFVFVGTLTAAFEKDEKV